MLDPVLLRAFLTIADTGSFTLAAARLNMTQSTISQQLRRLEEGVGHALIDRSARPVGLTPAGERLLGPARRLLSLQHEAETLLSDPAGTAAIRIGLPDDVVTPDMARIFAHFAQAHREMRLDVTTGLSRDLARRYRAGEFDIAIVKEPAAAPDHRAAFPESLGWFEGLDAPEHWPDPIPLVAFPPGGLYREAMFERIEREGRRWYIAFTASGLDSVLTAIEAGLGLSLLPGIATRGYRIRPSAAFGPETAQMVSVYAWESEGPIARLVAMMTAVLAAR